MKQCYLFFFLFVLCCCSYKEETNPERPIAPYQSFNLGISKDIISLSEEDAIKVSLLFKNRYKTKTANDVKSVAVFSCKDDSPALYVVNYDEGCTIVSATKKYHPIVADIEKGSISGPTNTGLDILIQQYIEEINQLSSKEDSPVLIEEWSQYEEHYPLSVLKTKVNDDYYEILDAFMDDWSDSEYQFKHIYEQFDDMPDEVYQQFRAYAEDTDYIGYPWLECAIVGRCEFASSHLISPMVTSTWHQLYPYYSGPGYLGCSTIAAGQIMRYFQYPEYYSWSLMPDSISSYNSTIGEFLQNLKSEIGVDLNGGATVYQVKNAFQAYGYTCSLISHNTSAICQSLQVGHPVYCRGKDINTNQGHAWVCDGMYYYDFETRFVLFTLRFINGEPVELEQNESYSTFYNSSVFFHINWGQGGNYNGYFYDGNLVYTNNSGQQRNYSSNDRQELILHH